MSVNPIPNADKFIKDTLSNAIPGTNVYKDKPPSTGAVYPCIVFSLYAHSNIGEVGSFDSSAELPVYTVKAISKGTNYDPANLLMGQVDTAFSTARGRVTWGGQTVTVQSVRGYQRFEMPETVDGGQEYRHSGRQYRLFISLFDGG
jgi:hypothetical protein